MNSTSEKEQRVLIAKRLKAIRASKHITQEQMAEMLDISYGTYVKIENGRQNLTMKRLLDICEILNITADTILYETVDRSETFCFDEFLLYCDYFSRDQLANTHVMIDKILKLKDFKENNPR